MSCGSLSNFRLDWICRSDFLKILCNSFCIDKLMIPWISSHADRCIASSNAVEYESIYLQYIGGKNKMDCLFGYELWRERTDGMSIREKGKRKLSSPLWFGLFSRLEKQNVWRVFYVESTRIMIHRILRISSIFRIDFWIFEFFAFPEIVAQENLCGKKNAFVIFFWISRRKWLILKLRKQCAFSSFSFFQNETIRLSISMTSLWWGMFSIKTFRNSW